MLVTKSMMMHTFIQWILSVKVVNVAFVPIQSTGLHYVILNYSCAVFKKSRMTEDLHTLKMFVAKPKLTA